jgi:hypothetical protein
MWNMNVYNAITLLVAMVRTGLAGLVLILLSACGFFSDDPATQAVQHVKTLVTMSEADYLLKRKDIAMREQTSIDYLRAMREQNTRLSFGIEDMRRPGARQREVTVTVMEKQTAGGRHERARYRAHVEQDADGVWKIVSLQLVE